MLLKIMIHLETGGIGTYSTTKTKHNIAKKDSETLKLDFSLDILHVNKRKVGKLASFGKTTQPHMHQFIIDMLYNYYINNPNTEQTPVLSSQNTQNNTNHTIN